MRSTNIKEMAFLAELKVGRGFVSFSLSAFCFYIVSTSSHELLLLQRLVCYVNPSIRVERFVCML